jgi:hypothetical protein
LWLRERPEAGEGGSLRKVGFTSELAYALGLGSVVASIVAWGRAKSADDKPSAQNWGIFVGLWAPTFMEIGNALKVEEK